MSECKVCDYAEQHGTWPVGTGAHCAGCHRTWTGMKEAHCAKCHEHFSTPHNFDLHIRRGGGCIPPGEPQGLFSGRKLPLLVPRVKASGVVWVGNRLQEGEQP